MIELIESGPFAGMKKNHYPVITCDPPWRTENWGEDGLPQRASEQHYETMTLDEMKALPVADLAHKNSVLLVWMISSHMQQADELARHWGFEFRSRAFTWRKVDKNTPPERLEDNDVSKMGMGRWTRQETEVAYLYGRGKPKRRSAGVREIINAPIREHSRKPDEIYSRMENLVKGPYLELFARTTWPNWDCWGNQTDKFSAKAHPLL